jgi:RNA polymerase sigma factor (sigma-70 family)
VVGDQRLVAQIRQGNDTAFEVAYERHGPGILSFCRHMLGSREDAEDAVQYAFAAAYRDLLRDDREINLKPWLYRIARNRCISVLRSRREAPSDAIELSTVGLAEKVERRVELRELLADLRELPSDQREALLLTEIGGLSHAEVSGVLGCEVAQVKALVFSARNKLIERRQARDAPCEEIREQLANLRGGSLRRNHLRHHLHGCHACREYRDEVQRQRRMLATALPVMPSAGLKAGVLGAAGLGQASAGGGGAFAALGASGATTSLGGATIAKVALLGVIGAGGMIADRTVVTERPASSPGPKVAAAHAPAAPEQARSKPIRKTDSAGESPLRPRGDRPARRFPGEPQPASTQWPDAPLTQPSEPIVATDQLPAAQTPSPTPRQDPHEQRADGAPPAGSNPRHQPTHASPPPSPERPPSGNPKPEGPGNARSPERPPQSQSQGQGQGHGQGPPGDTGPEREADPPADGHGKDARQPARDDGEQ